MSSGDNTSEKLIFGVFGAEVPPVPIPNTVVKLCSAENTWLEAAREDRAMPKQIQLSNRAVVFLFYGDFSNKHILLKRS